MWLEGAFAHADNPVDRMLWYDTHTYLPDDLLVKMDIASMHCGLEARSPLLDHELLELAARIPVRLTTQPYPLARADRALADLAHDRVTGAAVLRVRP